MSFSGRWTEANGSGGGAWNGRCTGPPAAAATTTTSSTPPRFLGCYKDPNNPFDLEGYLVRSAQNTPQRCIETCAARGFKLAGVQYGQSCLCGNNYGASTSACDDTRGGRYPLTA